MSNQSIAEAMAAAQAAAANYVPANVPAQAGSTAVGAPVAVNEEMASPSGSDAVTLTASNWFSNTETVAGAVTTGARSAGVTVMVVLAEPESAFAAVNVTE